MLTSYLKSGDVLDFAIDNTVPYNIPTIELLATDSRLAKLASIKLTPIEALTLCDHIHTLVDYLAQDITQSIQEKTPLQNLHPRAEQLLADADINPATGDHIDGTTRTTEKTAEKPGRNSSLSTGAQTDGSVVAVETQADAVSGPADGLFEGENPATGVVPGSGDDLLAGERGVSMVLGDSADLAGSGQTMVRPLGERGSDADQNKGMALGEPLFHDAHEEEVNWMARQLMAEDNGNQSGNVPLVVTNEGHVAPVSATLKLGDTMRTVPLDHNNPAHVQAIAFGECDADGWEPEDDDEVFSWQNGLDRFVDDLSIDKASISIQKNMVFFDICQDSEGHDTIKLPFALTVGTKLIKSPRVHRLIEEIACQAFRFGASWENARMDAQS